MSALPRFDSQVQSRAASPSQFTTHPFDPIPASVKHYGAGELIYFEGEPAKYCFQIITGAVKEYNTLLDGSCQILEFRFEEDYLGLVLSNDYPHTAEAITDCSLKCFPKESIFKNMNAPSEVSSQLVATLMGRLHEAEKRLVVLGRMTAMQRMVAFILRLCEQQGSASEVSLRMTRQDIADYLGLTIETVSRTFGELKKHKLIELVSSRRVAIPNKEFLKDVIRAGAA